MKLETLGCRKMALARFRIIFIYVAQSLQNITAWFREVRGHFHELPSSMREAVGQQDLHAATECGHIPRQGITHLNGPGEIRHSMLQHIAQIFARVLPPSEVQRDLPPLMGRYDATGRQTARTLRVLA